MADERQLLTIDEVAELLHVHRNTVERWTKAGHLVPAVRGPGRSPNIVRYDRDEVLAAVKGR